MNQLNLTPVVKNLLIINVLVLIGTLIIMGDNRIQLALFYPTAPQYQPYQFVTSVFMHADFMHLGLNMLGLVMFGSMIEQVWGARRFLFFYLICGIGANVIVALVDYVQYRYFGFPEPVVLGWGASGALYGLLLAFGMLFPYAKVGLLLLPIFIEARYAVFVWGGLELLQGVGNFNPGIGHFAHLGGMFVGWLVILYWRRFGSRL